MHNSNIPLPLAQDKRSLFYNRTVQINSFLESHSINAPCSTIERSKSTFSLGRTRYQTSKRTRSQIFQSFVYTRYIFDQISSFAVSARFFALNYRHYELRTTQNHHRVSLKTLALLQIALNPLIAMSPTHLIHHHCVC